MNNYKVKSMLRYLFHRISINLIFSPTICPSRIFIRPSFEEKSSKILINLKPTIFIFTLFYECRRFVQNFHLFSLRKNVISKWTFKNI